MGAAVGHLHDRRDDILAAHAFRVEELGHAELAAPLLSGPVDVDANDLVRTGKPRALEHVQSDAAEPEDDDIVADLHLCRVDHRADPGGEDRKSTRLNPSP